MNAFAVNLLPLATTEASLEIIGGKGRSLARMATSGMPVPGGFHLTTAVYRRFVEENNLQAAIVKLARPTITEGILSFDSASAAIRQLFEQAELSAEIISGVEEAYSTLDTSQASPAVAVRSSANAEDLPDMSFAGQQDTYLNVRGNEALIAAIRNCWASLWTARAISYRHRMGVDPDRVAMAVVVQVMLESEVSGILFTANPATGERSELIVNASFGLGEAIVSGEVTPDTYVLDRTSLAATETTLGAKELMITADGEQGTMTRPLAEAKRNESSLSAPLLAELAALALQVEAHFDDVPQDIEWALARDKLWLLQSRPITNLPPEPLSDVRWDPPEPGAYLGRSQLVEHIPDPVCTLFEDLHMKRSLQHFWGLNLTKRGNHTFEDTQPPGSFITQTTVNGYAYRHLGEPPRTGRLAAPKPLRRWLPVTISRRLTQARMYLGFVRRWRDIALPRYLSEVGSWARLDPEEATTEQLWAGIRAMSMAEARYWYDDGVWNAFSLTRGTEFQLHNFLEEHASGQFSSGQFLSGLPSRGYQAQVQLWRIAQMIRAEPGLLDDVIATPPTQLLAMLRGHGDAAAVCSAIDEYFQRYGHQIFTLDFVEPSEAEEPANLMQSLLSLVLQADYDPVARQRELAERRVAARRSARKKFKGQLQRRFLWRLWLARRFYPNREEAMFHMGRAWTVLRPLAHELGRRLTAVGTLTNPDDVFFLRTAELARAVRAIVIWPAVVARGREQDFPGGAGIPEYARLAIERRALREARRNLTPPMNIPGPPLWASAEEPSEHTDTNILKGSAVSPGRVTGEVSRILSPADFGNMKPGTILVCPTTTPAWTQLFPQAKGLVTDIGGILAHGSIVAREYGIPAVLGIADATQRIADGDVIIVDGDRGIVTLESNSSDDVPEQAS